MGDVNEYQGGPLRIFAPDLDCLSCCHQSTGSGPPSIPYWPRGHPVGLHKNRVAVKLERPSPIFPSPNML